jgi:REP element-mobilizing transposase RayT
MQDKFQNKYRIPSARLQNWDYSSNGAYFITICTQNREHYFGEIKDAAMQISTIGQLAEQYWKEIPNHFPFVELGNFVVMPNHIHGILIINKLHNDITAETRLIASENNDNMAETRLIASVRDNIAPNTRLIASENDDITVETRLIASVRDNIAPNTRLIASENDDNTVETRLIASVRDNIAPNTQLIAPENNDIAPENDDNLAETRLIASVRNEIASVRGDEMNIGDFAGDKNPMFHDSISKIIRWYKGRCSFEIRKSHSSFVWQSRFHDHIIRNAHSFENIQNYIRDNPQKWKEDKFF